MLPDADERGRCVAVAVGVEQLRQALPESLGGGVVEIAAGAATPPASISPVGLRLGYRHVRCSVGRSSLVGCPVGWAGQRPLANSLIYESAGRGYRHSLWTVRRRGSERPGSFRAPAACITMARASGRETALRSERPDPWGSGRSLCAVLCTVRADFRRFAGTGVPGTGEARALCPGLASVWGAGRGYWPLSSTSSGSSVSSAPMPMSLASLRAIVTWMLCADPSVAFHKSTHSLKQFPSFAMSVSAK